MPDTLIISLSLGLLFSMGGFVGGGNNLMFLQPSGWMLALFAVPPIVAWVQRGSSNFRSILAAILLLIGAVHDFATFNFGHRVGLGRDFVEALSEMRQMSQPDDVVVYWPEQVSSQPVLGHTSDANNFYVLAFTGLRAYYSAAAYTERLSAPTRGRAIYEERASAMERIINGTADAQLIGRLNSDGVRWVVIAGPPPARLPPNVIDWRSTPDFTILCLERCD